MITTMVYLKIGSKEAVTVISEVFINSKYKKVFALIFEQVHIADYQIWLQINQHLLYSHLQHLNNLYLRGILRTL